MYHLAKGGKGLVYVSPLLLGRTGEHMVTRRGTWSHGGHMVTRGSHGHTGGHGHMGVTWSYVVT